MAGYAYFKCCDNVPADQSGQGGERPGRKMPETQQNRGFAAPDEEKPTVCRADFDNKITKIDILFCGPYNKISEEGESSSGSSLLSFLLFPEKTKKGRVEKWKV